MRVGFSLPQVGPVASPRAIARVGKRAEDLGYDSVWVLDRILYPVNPQTKTAGTPDGSLPEQYKRVFDPLVTLTFVAAQTSRIGLGTCVLDMPYYNPVMLARQLTSLDVLSGGRLRVGLGQGWSKDEYDASGASMKGRGERADEFIRVLKAIWTTDPVEFQGKYFHIPKSIIQPKPVQRPHPPIYLASFSTGGLKRTATMADGWMPVQLSVDEMKVMFDQLKSLAKDAGRNPDDLKVAVRANLFVMPEPLDKNRWMFTGSLQQIGTDIQAVREFGIDELILDSNYSPDSQTEEGIIRSMERLRELL